ncbi:hypothetical protein GCM10007933_02400 [Zoogloea oryzae]|uniref:Uncharacterized protein n=1 Tax=Zoogloea oryzae TaxID=310767 RepID=A0ABQ6F5G7_9RHOO|nr:hypothetical protein [Zoogloea oryzae]GLT20788.1 hypothetical protein GCM10007933_02400 [Zoogloea oryzae]
MATKHYRIRPGFTFRDGDQIKGGGEHIELSLDMALFHRDKLEEQPVACVEEPAGVGAGVAEPSQAAEAAEGVEGVEVEGVQTSAQVEAVEG